MQISTSESVSWRTRLKAVGTENGAREKIVNWGFGAGQQVVGEDAGS